MASDKELDPASKIDELLNSLMCLKLGGWQRLGVVLAIAWTLGVGGFVWINEWPDVDQIQAAIDREDQRLQHELGLRPAQPVSGETNWENVDPPSWAVSADVRALQQFESERSAAVRVGLLLWLVPLSAVAIVGYASRWVYDGFRLQREAAAPVERSTTTVGVSAVESPTEQRQHQERPAYAELGGLGEPITAVTSNYRPAYAGLGGAGEQATELRSNVDEHPPVDQPSAIAGGSEARRMSAKRCPSCGLLNHEAAARCAGGYGFAGSLASADATQFAFTGQGRDILSGEGLKLLLQYISIIGIPWGWLTTFRWATRQMSLNTGTALRFEGTVGEAWGFMVLFVFSNLLGRWDYANTDVFVDAAPDFLAIAAFAWVAVLWVLAAYIRFHFLKWGIERTSLSSGLKPVFRGGFWASAGWQTLTIVSIFTVVGWAWVTAAYLRWICRSTDVNGYQGRFEGTGLQVLWRSLVAILGCIPLVTIPAMFCWWSRWLFSQVKGVAEPTVVGA